MLKKRQTLTKSFVGAFRGIGHAVAERNFLIQTAVGFSAIVLAFALNLALWEKVVIIILTALVLAAEIINSAFERLLDTVIKEHSREAARIKELMAAAVFIFSLAAFLVGLWLFGRAVFGA